MAALCTMMLSVLGGLAVDVASVGHCQEPGECSGHGDATALLQHARNSETMERVATEGLRLVYLDMGANWANTMRLCLDLENTTLKEPIAKAAEKFGGVTRPWEVYSFEAMPEIQVYVESVIMWIEGRGPQPAVPFPPSGSSADYKRFYNMFGCDESQCMIKRSEEAVERWRDAVPDRLHQLGLDSNTTLTQRLGVANRRVPVGSKPRYTLVPAGVSDKFQHLEVPAFNVWSSARGGIYSDSDYLKRLGSDIPKSTITLVDTVSWMLDHFSPDDFVVVKMDVEGAEFQVLPPLLASPRNPMKMLFWECHNGHGGQCSTLKDLVKQSKIPSFKEGSGYQGFDSFSRPEDYLIDPQFDPRAAWSLAAKKV